MTSNDTLDRRRFIAAPVAAAALAALPATLAAAPAPAGPATGKAAGARLCWAAAGADDLAPLIGRRFRFAAEDGTRAVLRLVAVERAPSGPARPPGLPRAEGVVAVFGGPDAAPLVSGGSRLCRVSHPGIGAATLLAGPVRERDGATVVEIVLG